MPPDDTCGARTTPGRSNRGNPPIVSGVDPAPNPQILSQLEGDGGEGTGKENPRAPRVQPALILTVAIIGTFVAAAPVSIAAAPVVLVGAVVHSLWRWLGS
jgi:hypothetical protein